MGNKYDAPAVLRGTIFCAPWCGCKCTKAAFDRAVKESEALAARMGHGWETHVWENMGWYYHVRKGCVKCNSLQSSARVLALIGGSCS